MLPVLPLAGRGARPRRLTPYHAAIRDVLGDDRPRCHSRVLPDVDTGENHGTGPDRRAFLDDRRLREVGRFPLTVDVRVHVVGADHAGTNEDVRADDAIRRKECIGADASVIADYTASANFTSGTNRTVASDADVLEDRGEVPDDRTLAPRRRGVDFGVDDVVAVGTLIVEPFHETILS